MQSRRSAIVGIILAVAAVADAGDSLAAADQLRELARRGDGNALGRHSACSEATAVCHTIGGTPRSQPLTLAATFGHSSAARALLLCKTPQSSDANAEGAAVATVYEMANRLAVTDLMGQTPLHIAARQGHVNVVTELLEWRADVRLQDRAGLTSLLSAAQRGHTELVQVLAEAAPDSVRIASRLGRTALHIAAWFGYTEVLEQLLAMLYTDSSDAGVARAESLEARDLGGRSALQLAVTNGHESSMLLLLEARADAQTKDREGRSPLHSAAGGCQQAVARILLEAKPNSEDVDILDRRGRTPLHGAASTGCAAVTRLLRQYGADPRLADLEGSTPANEAAKAKNVKVLAAMGKLGLSAAGLGKGQELLKKMVKGLDGIMENLLALQRAASSTANR